MDVSWKERLKQDKPRWLILIIDLTLVWGCFLISYILIFKHRGVVQVEGMLSQSLIAGVIYLGAFYLFKPYRGIIRRTELRDLFVITKSIAVAFISLFVISELLEIVLEGRNYWFAANGFALGFSQTQLLLHAMMSGIALVLVRFVYKTLYHNLFWTNKGNKISVVLFGAGNMGSITFDLLQTGSRNRYRVAAIVDDDPQRIGKRIQGIKVRALQDLTLEMLQEIGGAQELIIAIDNHYPERLKRISAQAEPLPLKMKIIPNSSKLLEGAVATRQIRTLKIGDLLGRKAIEINNPVVFEALHGKVVLVTGGAGSIGSELVRQIARTNCKKLVVLDQAESALYDLQQELRTCGLSERIDFVVANVRNLRFIESVFKRYLPQVVFHAAAYKHVPLMEVNPYEAVLTNVVGSCQVAQLAHQYSAEKFVMVSTDKAVNPTNVMGATKRIAEIYVSALNKVSDTAFVVTRFGNVLGSNGSVIPLFEKQIKAGGPLTITHPDITRYFMTIPEACKLVQEAGVMGKGGEVFVFDMGDPVKIIDLAKQMIRLKGLTYPTDIDIKIVGLRPGEKIYEELLAKNEDTAKTYHEKIMIAKVNTDDVDQRKDKIDHLCAIVQDADPYSARMQLVALIKEIVPEYISQNSVFEKLDGGEELSQPKNVN